MIAELENNVLKRKFIYGPGIDEPVMMIKVDGATETRYYYHYDGLGSVIALSNVNRQIVESYSYDSFGQPSNVSSVGNPYLFTGRDYDTETGLYYYRARMYNPVIGRFMQTDPIGYKGGINLYAYCGNNPIMLVDPLGLCDSWVDNVISSAKRIYSELSDAPQQIGQGLGAGIDLTAYHMSLGLVGDTQHIDDLHNYYGGYATASQALSYTSSGALAAAGGFAYLGLDVVIGGGAVAASNPESTRVVGNTLQGFQGSLDPFHAITRIIERGVSPQAILNTLRNPNVIVPQGERLKYMSDEAVIIMNSQGQMVTTWKPGQ